MPRVEGGSSDLLDILASIVEDEEEGPSRSVFMDHVSQTLA